jgi:AcrR family transcriptional regulator
MELNKPSDGNRYERTKEKTRQKIIEVAINLFNKQGFDSTSLEQIAEKADVARKTLYNHFPAKESIILEYLQRLVIKRAPEVDRMIQAHADTRSRLVAVLNQLTEWSREVMTTDIFRIYVSYQMQKIMTSPYEEIQRSGAKNFLAEIILLGQDSGEIRRDVPLEILVSQVDNIRVSAGMRLLTDPEKFTAHDYIKKSIDLFLCGAEYRSDNNC